MNCEDAAPIVHSTRLAEEVGCTVPFPYEFGVPTREPWVRRDKTMTWSAGRPWGNREVKRNT